VYAAAVVLPRSYDLPGLADSKVLTRRKRERLAIAIKNQAVSWSVAWSEVQEIDSLNILQASLLAMQRAVQTLKVRPSLAMVDGRHGPDLDCVVQTVVKGDATEPAISAAAILAKVHRDALMIDLDKKFPRYGLALNKGYPTRYHLQALRRYGASPIHRRSFAPVREALSQVELTV
jgi:ribonuclease HII